MVRVGLTEVKGTLCSRCAGAPCGPRRLDSGRDSPMQALHLRRRHHAECEVATTMDADSLVRALKSCPVFSLSGTSTRLRIAVVGEGNAGKTVVSRLIRDYIFPDDSCLIEVDHFIMDRSRRQELDLSGYDPRAFDLAAMRAVLLELHRGGRAWHPHYDHSSGVTCRVQGCVEHPHEVEPCEVQIVVGAFLWHPELSDLSWDESIYCIRSGTRNDDMRMARDVGERGYTPEYARRHLKMLAADIPRYILPSLSLCGLVVELHETGEYSLHENAGELSDALKYRERGRTS